MDGLPGNGDIYTRPDGSLVGDAAPAMADADSQARRVMHSMSSFATLSEALRLLGAIVILASMSIFLLQGWQQGNDVNQYMLLLAQTALLAAGGFALSFGLRENKGARIFFGLALIAVPANFTVLGALIYSLLQWDGALTQLPQIATWVVGDSGQVALTLAAAMLALVPITLLGFAIMARPKFQALSLHFLLLNGLLLLPLRSSTPVGIILLLATLYALFGVRRMSTSGGALKTAEGRFALACLFIPLGVMTFRTVYFYQFDALLALLVASAVLAILRQTSRVPHRSSGLAVVLQSASLPLAFVVALCAANVLEPYLPAPLLAPVFAIVFGVLAGDTAAGASSERLRRIAHALIYLLVAASFVLNATAYSGPVTAVACLLAGSGIALAGHSSNNNVALLSGYASAAIGLAFAISELIAMFVHSSWLELALIGAFAIVLGSLLDRHGAVLKMRLRRRLSHARDEPEMPLAGVS